MSDAALPTNQEDREVYLRNLGVGKLVDILKAGGIVDIEPDSTWMPDDLYVAISYARVEGATVTITMDPPDPLTPLR
jgi:hypothetical protein